MYYAIHTVSHLLLLIPIVSSSSPISCYLPPPPHSTTKGASQDYLVVGSDSGRIAVLFYNSTTNAFDKVHQETYGKTGCRRVIPGQYLASDPQGRAVMIGKTTHFSSFIGYYSPWLYAVHVYVHDPLLYCSLVTLIRCR